jgi:hypothetical protein
MKFNDATSILFDSIDWSDLASTIAVRFTEKHTSWTFNARRERSSSGSGCR